MSKSATNRQIYSHISKHKGSFSIYSITIIDTVIDTITRKQKELYYINLFENQDIIWTQCHLTYPKNTITNFSLYFINKTILTNKQVASYFTFGYSYKYNRLVILNHCD